MGLWDAPDLSWRFTRTRLAQEFGQRPSAIDAWSFEEVTDALAMLSTLAEIERTG